MRQLYYLENYHQPMDTVVLFVIQIVIIVFVLSILLAQRLFNNLRSLDYIILVFFFTLLRSLADFITLDNPNPWNVGMEYHYIFMFIANIFVYRYFVYIYKEKMDIIGITFTAVSFSIFAIFCGQLYFTNLNQNPEYWTALLGSRSERVPFFTFPLDLFTLFLWYFGIFVSFTLVKANSKITENFESYMLLFTTIFASFAATLELSEHFFGRSFDGNLYFIIPFILIIVLFVYNPYFSYYSPHNVLEMKIYYASNRQYLVSYTNTSGSDNIVIEEKLPPLNSIISKFYNSKIRNVQDYGKMMAPFQLDGVFTLKPQPMMSKVSENIRDPLELYAFSYKSDNIFIKLFFSDNFGFAMVFPSISGAIIDAMKKFYEDFIAISQRSEFIEAKSLKIRRLLLLYFPFLKTEKFDKIFE